MAQKLMKSFRQFNKAIWHRKSTTSFKPSEIRVLFCIRKGSKTDAAGITVSDISAFLHVTSPTITQLINGLESVGLVEKSVDLVDRRVVRVKLTDKGERIAQKEIDAYLASLNGLIEYLGEEDSERLAELLLKVYTYYTEIETAAEPEK